MTTAPSGIRPAASAAVRSRPCSSLAPSLGSIATRAAGLAPTSSTAAAERQRPDAVLAGGRRAAPSPRIAAWKARERRARRGSRASKRQLLARRRPCAAATSPTGCWVMHVASRSASPRCHGPRSRCRRICVVKRVVELGEQRRSGSASTPITPSSRPARAMPALTASCADDLDRLVAEHEAQRVGIVHGDVEDDAAAGLGPGRCASPAGAAAGRRHGRRGRRAACRCGPRRSRRAWPGGCAALRRWWLVPMHDAGRRGRRRPSARASASVSASGFSHSTCLPAAAAASVCVAMQLVGGRDVDGVDVGRRAARRASCGARDAVLVGIGRAALGVWSSSPRPPRRPSARMAPIMHSLAIVLAPIRPQRTVMPRLLSCRLRSATAAFAHHQADRADDGPRRAVVPRTGSCCRSIARRARRGLADRPRRVVSAGT